QGDEVSIAHRNRGRIGVAAIDNDLYRRGASRFNIAAKVSWNDEGDQGSAGVDRAFDFVVTADVLANRKISRAIETANEFATGLRLVLIPNHHRNIVHV